MLKLVRTVLPGPVKQRIKQLLGRPLTHLHEQWSILAPIGPVETPHTVLDVGAFRGWFFHCWRDWCPTATVHAFEPTPEAFAKLQQRYATTPAVALRNAAVGSHPDELSLNIMEQSAPSNSLLRHRPDVWDAIQYQTGSISATTVPVLTLDDYCKEQSIASVYILKIDVQGYELEVLKGAVQTLDMVDHILVESGIMPLYEDASRFTEVAEFLLDRGFHLMDMRAWHRGNHVLVETDMLFRTDRLAPRLAETGVDRFYKSAS